MVVWAEGLTRFRGTISARGGTRSGDGGLVEVSGKQQLSYQGLVDTTAPNGNPGTLLLDPDNITIIAGAVALVIPLYQTSSALIFRVHPLPFRKQLCSLEWASATSF